MLTPWVSQWRKQESEILTVKKPFFYRFFCPINDAK